MTVFAQALTLYETGRLKEAIPYFQAALRQSPDDLNVLYHTALTLVAMRDYQGCAKWLSGFLPHIDEQQTEPWLMSGFHYNLGVAHEASGEWTEAESCYRRALEFDPTATLPLIQLAGCAYRLGRPEEGHRLDDEVLKREEMAYDAKSSRALIKLLRGDYLGGFQEYELRWKLPSILTQAYIPKHAKRWKGEPLPFGKRILVVAEQGVGDVLMMARYVPKLVEIGVRPILIVHGGLVRLFEASFPGCEVYAMREQHPQAGWWVPMLSLPGIFKTTLETIPPAVCLKVPEDHITLPTTKFRVGWVSKGNSLHMGDKDRSCHDAAAWQRLLDMASHHCIDFEALDETHLKKRYGMRDFADTAGIIAQCDLVISIDSAAAHCAGSLGVPVWLLPPAAPEWRWLLDRDDSPWYPMHRLFRRTHVDAWPEVIDRVQTELEATCVSR